MNEVYLTLGRVAATIRDCKRMLDRICHQDLARYSPTVITYPDFISLKLAVNSATLVVVYGGMTYKISKGSKQYPSEVVRRAVHWAMHQAPTPPMVESAIALGLMRRDQQVNQRCEIPNTALARSTMLVPVACQIYLAKRRVRTHLNITLHRMLNHDYSK